MGQLLSLTAVPSVLLHATLKTWLLLKIPSKYLRMREPHGVGSGLVDM